MTLQTYGPWLPRLQPSIPINNHVILLCLIASAIKHFQSVELSWSSQLCRVGVTISTKEQCWRSFLGRHAKNSTKNQLIYC